MSLNRVNINNVSPNDRQRLAQLVFDYVTEEIMEEHRSFKHGNWQTFIPWHREFLGRLEQYVGSVFPYWDPAEPIPQEFAIVKRFNDGWNYFPLRNLFINVPIPSWFIPPQVCTFANFKTFAESLEYWHGTIHTNVGGAMGAIQTSPAALIFWCFHGLIDLIGANFEQCQ